MHACIHVPLNQEEAGHFFRSSFELLAKGEYLQVLLVLDVIMPGESRMRGVMLYELHLPNVMLANR